MRCRHELHSSAAFACGTITLFGKTMQHNLSLAMIDVLAVACQLTGTVFLAYGLIISKNQAIELGVTRVAYDEHNENVKLPQVADRLKQSRNAIIGLSFSVVGYGLAVYSLVCR